MVQLVQIYIPYNYLQYMIDVININISQRGVHTYIRNDKARS